MTAITLESGNLTATVHPEIGGSLTSFRLGGLDLLRPANPVTLATKNALDTSCYPLVPFSNRIKDSVLRFQGREYKLEPNFPDHPHALHGHAYRGPWTVVSQSSASLRLRFRYQGPDFPSAYAATERFTLTEDSLAIDLEVENAGSEPMPAGLGLHPFFAKPKDTELQASIDGVWLMALNDGIPTERVAVPAEWDFSKQRPLGDVVLDHCFTGWKNRHAIVNWPSRSLRVRLTAEGPTEHIVVFVPEGQEFFCVEPVTNMNDGFNRADRGEQGTGTVILNPGEKLAIRMVVAVERK
ncbi:MAG: aldose 1-epimerase [Polyangiaceae bacterium]|nr:aldose 1-epimerase [Polyangiaceae bacterium]